MFRVAEREIQHSMDTVTSLSLSRIYCNWTPTQFLSMRALYFDFIGLGTVIGKFQDRRQFHVRFTGMSPV